MKTCEYYQQQISRLLDGDLTAQEETALFEHIVQCPDCARTYDTYSRITSVLRSDLEEPPAALSQLVMARINGTFSPDQAPEPEKRTAPVHRLRPWRKVAAAACFVVLVAAGAITGVFGRGSRPEQTVQANDSADLSAAYRPAAQGSGAAVPQPTAPLLATAPPQDMPEQPMTEAAPEPASAQEAAPPEQAPPEARSAPEPAAETQADMPSAPDQAADQLPAQVPEVVENAPAAVSADSAALDAEQAEDAASAESGIMTIMEPPVDAGSTSDAAGQVYDSLGQPVGRIADTQALDTLLTGQPWQGAEPEPVYTVTVDGTDYVFARDESGALLWQRAGDTGFTLSASPLSALEALIEN